MRKKITSVLIVMLCVLMAVPWGVFAQAVNAEKNAEKTQQQTTAPAPTPTPEQPAETPAEPRDESASTLADYPAGRAVLDTGVNVNNALRALSGDPSSYEYSNNDITAILRSNSSAPSGVTTKNLSISNVPVTAWWDDNTATIYWYSVDPKPMLNVDSSNMFNNYLGLTSLDVSHFDTSNVTNMGGMFWGCSSLTELNVSNFDTSNVTNMGGMFLGNNNLTRLDVSHFDTSKVTDMRRMFGCSSLTSLDVSHFDTSKVTDMNSMFAGCGSLKRLDVTSFDTSNVITMHHMFNSCKNLITLDLSHFNTSKVNGMSDMFHNCKSLVALDVSHFDTSKVTNMNCLFADCESLVSLDVSSFDTSNVTNMNSMFSHCRNIVDLDLSNFDTSKVSVMRGMFHDCEKLKTINVSDKFITGNVQNASGDMHMFLNCSSLTGGNGTTFDANHIDAEYARIDKPGQPGYFTEKGSSSNLYPNLKNFVWGVDNFSFTNFTLNFFNIIDTIFAQKTHRMLMDPKYIDALTRRLNPKEYTYIIYNDTSEPLWTDDNGKKHYEPKIDKEWNGSCQGMSTLVLLGKAGMVPYSEYAGSSIHTLPKPIDSREVSSLIAYYQLTQYTNYGKILTGYASESSSASNIKRIVQGLKSTGIVLVGYTYPGGGHTVIAYGEGDGRTIDGKTYDKSIKVCDPNDTSEKSNNFIYYDSKTYEWVIPNEHKIKSTDSKTHFNTVISDPDAANYKGYLTSSVKTSAADAMDNGDISTLEDMPYVARLEIYQGNVSDIKKVIKDAKGNYVQKVDQGDGSDIVEETIYDGDQDAKGTPGYTLYDAESAYQVTQDTAGPMELILDYENTLYHVRAEKAKSVIFDKNGFVSVDADKGNCAVEMTNNNDNPTDWFTNYAKTTDATKLSMTKTNQGYEVASDNLKDTKVMAANKEETKEEKVSTQKDKMIICETKKDLDVKVDNTGDGNYETSIVDNDEPEAEQPTAALYTMIPSEVQYNGQTQKPTITPKAGAGAVEKVHYYKDGAEIAGEPKDAGVYTVKIDTKVTDTYAAAKELEIGTFTIKEKASTEQAIAYRTHVQNVGWQPYVTNGTMAGTSGQSLRLEGMNINLQNQKYSGDIEYRTHIQNIGWESEWKKNDAMSGTSNRGLRLEAMQVRLTGEMAEKYDVYYRVHAQNIGWLGWAKNGEESGTAGYGYRLEAMQIMLVDKGGAAPTIAPTSATDKPFAEKFKDNVKTDSLVAYQNHVQNVGWQNYAVDGGVAGTSGLGYRLEGMKVFLNNPKYKGDIEYRTHIQNIG